MDDLPRNKIFLQVRHLKEGAYELNIIHRGKILLTTYFNKE